MQTREQLEAGLLQTERNIVTMKRTAVDAYGPTRSEWPGDVLESIHALAEQAKNYRRALGLRKD